MSFRTLLLLCLPLAVMLRAQSTVAPAPALPEPSYRLNFGDRVSVAIFGEPDLGAEQLIDHHGKIRLPLVGEITVAGCTVREAERLIETTYRSEEMLKEPQVTLAMVAYAPREIMVLGAVRVPGAFQFPPDTVSLDIRDVIARQGGFTPVAKSDAVAVTRRQADGREETSTVNVEHMMYKRSRKHEGEPAFLVFPGDRIFVPERLF